MHTAFITFQREIIATFNAKVKQNKELKFKMSELRLKAISKIREIKRRYAKYDAFLTELND